MGRVFIIARSEFITAVRARGFLIGIMLMPILFGGAVLLQRVVDQQANGIPRHVAVIDDTGELYSRLSERCRGLESRRARHSAPGSSDGPTVHAGAGDAVRRIAWRCGSRSPSASARRSCSRSSRCPPGLLGGDGSAQLRYYSGAPAYRELPDWLQRTVLKEVVKRRFEHANVSPLVVASLLKPIAVEELGLLGRDADGSRARGPAHVDRVRVIGIPRRLHVPALPHRRDDDAAAAERVLEEKMSRISEVLLGAVTPFELMLGKLLASTSVSAVMTLVYLTGGAWTAHRWGYLDARRAADDRAGSSSSCCCRS